MTRRRAGLTLLEFSLVAVVLVVAAAAVLPALPGFARGQRLRTTASRLAAMARYGQEWSTIHGRGVVLSYDEEGRRFRLEVDDQALEELLADPAPVVDGGEPPAPDQSASALALPEDVEVVATEAGGSTATGGWEVRFQPDGSGEDGSVVLGVGERRCTVRFEGRRGRVSVEEGDELQDGGRSASAAAR